ncbi:MAG: UDP-N-acetylmuramoyl-tripeptide--D-alanyl-D-alanine ligase, partial [Elusimicrobiota bacterium]
MDLQTTWGALAQAAGGTLVRGAPESPAGKIATDSRTLRAGEVFLALKGPRFDAHDLLDARPAREASGWIVRRGASLPKDLPGHVLEVPDTLAALSDIAAAHRSRFAVPVVAITGSNGKTTVKEMLRSALSQEGPVCANAGNFNNEVGLPLSVLELGKEHRFGVFEMGASKAGDIAALCRVARPTLGVLTNIGSAHLEFFGSLEGTLKAKSELLDALPAQGPVVLNLDDMRLRTLLPRLGARAVTFGTRAEADVRLEYSPGRVRLAFSGRGSLPSGVL